MFLDNNFLLIAQLILDIVLLLSVVIIYRKILKLDVKRIQATYELLEKSSHIMETIKEHINVLDKNLKEKERLSREFQKIFEDIKKELSKNPEKSISEQDLSTLSEELTKGELELIQSIKKLKK